MSTTLSLLSPQSGLDAVESNSGITLEWVESLPEELKNAALHRLFKTIEAKPTLVELFAINQVIYRTVSGNTFTESAESTAKRTGHDRKTILKGLDQAVKQNILEKNERPGTSTEYSFKPVEEWLPEPLRVRQSPTEGNPPSGLDSPVVHIKDIRTSKIIEFPKIHDTDEAGIELQLSSNDGVVQIKDDPETDANVVVVSLKEEQQQLEVSIPAADTPKSPWKYVGQGLPRVYMPPELDQETGSKIESIHEATSRPRQFILKEAVDLLYNQLNRKPSFLEEKRTPNLTSVGAVSKAAVSPTGIPDEVLVRLSDAGIDLGIGTAERLWLKHGDRFEAAIAYVKAQDEAGKIKQSKEGFFRKSLEENWNLVVPLKSFVESRCLDSNSGIDEPTDVEMALIDEAISSGKARDKYYGTHGWLVIRLSGHSEPWRDFLYK